MPVKPVRHIASDLAPCAPSGAERFAMDPGLIGLFAPR